MSAASVGCGSSTITKRNPGGQVRYMVDRDLRLGDIMLPQAVRAVEPVKTTQYVALGDPFTGLTER